MPCVLCSVRLEKVQDQRDRILAAIRHKCMSTVEHAIRMCAEECIHAYFWRTVVHWVNVSFSFHCPSSALLWKVPASLETPCSMACLFRFREKIVHFLRSFVSYSTPICLLHLKHAQQLERVTKCCPDADVSPYKTVVDDMSIQIFIGANALFFNNQLRHSNLRTPHHFIKLVENGNKDVCPPLVSPTPPVTNKRARVCKSSLPLLLPEPPHERDAEGQGGDRELADFIHFWNE